MQAKVNTALLEMQKEQSAQLMKHIPDPSLTHQRDKLRQDVQRENCILTVHSSTVTEEGYQGWNQVRSL